MTTLHVFVVISMFLCYGLADDFCTSMPDGYYSDPESCFHYFNCFRGQGKAMPCAEGTMWDDNIKTCTHSSGCTRNPSILHIRMKEYCLDFGMKIGDNPFESTEAKSVVDCARICTRNDKCDSFNYMKIIGDCQLFNITVDIGDLIVDKSFLYGHDIKN